MVPRDPLREQWSEKIRFTRAHHRLTQAAFARLVNVTGQTISDWERGKTFPSAEYRALLMKLFAKAELERAAKENGEAV